MSEEIGAVRASASFESAAFDAGVKTARSALRSLMGGFQETSREAVRSADNMASAWDGGLSRTERAAQKHVNKLLGVDRATKATSATTRAWVSQLDRNAKAFDNLRASLDPVYASSKRYEAAVEKVELAVRSGIVTQKEANTVLKQAATQYLGAGEAAQRASTPTRGFLGLFSKKRSHDLHQIGLQLSQVGQHGAVTGDYLQAAAIQAADLGAVFGVVGIAAGTAISVLGPMALELLRTGDSANELKDNLEGLADAMSRVESAQVAASAGIVSLTDHYGEYASSARELLSIQREMANLEAMFALSQAVQSISNQFGTFTDVVDDMGQTIRNNYEQTLRNLKKEFGLTSFQAAAFAQALQQVGQVETPAAQAEALRRAREQIELASGGLLQMDKETRAVYESLLNAELAASRLAGIDMASTIGAAADEGNRLKSELAQALALFNTVSQAQSKLYSGRGGDPRDFLPGGSKSSYEQALGYETVDEIVVRLTKNLKKAGGAAKTASESAVQRLTAEIGHRSKLLTLTGDQRKRYEAIHQVQQRLGKDAAKLSKAQISGLADQLIALEDQEAALERVANMQDRWAENITRTAFEGGSLSDTVKGMLKDIAYQFAHSKVVLPIVASVTSILGLDQLVLGGARSAVSSALGGGGGAGTGLLGGLLGNVGGGLLGGGGFLGGVGTGLGGVLSGGGLGSSFANLGGLLSGTSGGAGAIGAAIPAIGIAIAGLAVLSKALSRKYAGTAIRGTLGTDGFDGTSFDFYKGGALRSNKANYKEVPEAIQAMLDTTMRGVTTGLTSMATVLGLSTGALAGFNDEQFTLWTNGKDQAQIQQELGVFIDSASEKMAELVLGTDAFTRTGESANDTLTRLSTGLSTANDQADLLGHRMFTVSLAGADMASMLVDAFGGVEAMSTATGAYWQAVYSESERTEITIRRLRATFADLGVVMPESRGQLRALVESFDTTTESGRNLYAQVMGLSGALDQVLPQVAQFTLSMDGLLTSISGEIGTQLDLARGMASDAKAASSLWYRTATTLRDFLSDLLNSDLSAASAGQTSAVNRARFESAYALARGGDVDAARSIPELAKAYLNSARAESSTALEYRRIAGMVQGQVQFLSGLSELEGANKDVLQSLYEEQIGVLTALGNFLQLEGLTNEQIGQLDSSIQGLAADWDGTLAGFQTSLGSLQSAIEATEAFSYDALRERLNIAVDILPSANIPPYLADLIGNAKTGLSATIDFAVRADGLTPDLRWLALQSASEHVKTLDLVLSSGVDPKALSLALDATGAYDVAVRAAMAADLSADVRRIVFADGGTYATSVRAALDPSVPEGVRRALLDQQGDLAVNVSGILAQNMPASVRALLLEANTAALRGVTIAAVYADTLGAEDLALLRETSTEAMRTIQAEVNPAGITATGLVFLDQLTRSGRVRRAIEGTMYTSRIGWTDSALLTQLHAGPGEVRRALDGQVFANARNWTGATLLRLFAAGDGATARNLRSAIYSDTRNWTGAAILKQLNDGDGATARNLRSAVYSDTRNWTGATLLGLFAKGDGATARNLRSAIYGNARNWTGAALLSQLQAGSGSIDRIVNGSVNVSGLSDEQRALLLSISGATSGTLTLGGSFQFDPSSGFSTWFGTTVQDGIASPMSVLTGALAELRSAVVGQTQEMRKAEAVLALDAYAEGMLKDADGQYVATAAQLQEMAARAGIDGSGSPYALAAQLAGISANDKLHSIDVDPSGFQTRQLLEAYVGTAGLQVDPTGYRRAYPSVAENFQGSMQAHFDRHGRDEIINGSRSFDARAFDWKSIGLNIPGFANGGNHMGGARIVGERGPELEITGPSRIVNNSDTKAMFDQTPLLEELAEVRRELAKSRDENRQLLMAVNSHAKQTASILRRFQKDPGSLKVTTA
jgi:hypothetical protein